MPLTSYERVKRYREKKRQEAESAKLAEVEASKQVYALGQKVLSDPDLMFLVEKVGFRSEMYREKFKSYRRSLQGEKTR